MSPLWGRGTRRSVPCLEDRAMDAGEAAAAGMLAAETQFRRVKGCEQLPQLARALEQATADEPGRLELTA